MPIAVRNLGPVAPPRVCRKCGRKAGQDGAKFYPKNGNMCSLCARKLSLASRRKPGVRERTNKYNSNWLIEHKDVRQRAQRALLKRQKAAKEAAWPAEKMTVAQAVDLLGFTRQRLHQYIQSGDLPAEKYVYSKGKGFLPTKKGKRYWLNRADVEALRVRLGKGSPGNN